MSYGYLNRLPFRIFHDATTGRWFTSIWDIRLCFVDTYYIFIIYRTYYNMCLVLNSVKWWWRSITLVIQLIQWKMKEYILKKPMRSSCDLMACRGGGWSPDSRSFGVCKSLSPDLVTITMSSAGRCHVSFVYHCFNSFRIGIWIVAVGGGRWYHNLSSGGDPSVTFQVA